MNRVYAFLTVFVLAFSVTPAMAGEDLVGDPVKGEKVFKKCKACHQVGDKAKSAIGPILNGVVGRKVAGAEGFKYSKAMQAAGDEGMIWTEENLSGYLEKPRKFMPKNRMSFAGLKKEKDRKNVIAYLKQFSD